MRLIIALILAFAATPTLANHNPAQPGTYHYCLTHGGTPAVCRCLRQPLSC